jgi:hypothetical protein
MSYLALVLTLPASAPSERTRLWRALKALGCGTLREGLYVLPAAPEHETALQQVADEARAAGGSGQLLALAARDAAQASALQGLFDRTDDYAALSDELGQLLLRIRDDGTGAMRSLRALQRRYEQLGAIDFFAGTARAEVGALLETARAEASRSAAPDEPHTAPGLIRRLDPKAYRARRWATRKRPWVDRLASAWLIKRHIDPKAQFVWVDRPEQCRGSMVGYDFDGAEFSHTGERVTFQTLAASFGLDSDVVIARIGDSVRYLDAGGVPTAEARGLETLLVGVRESLDDDDRLLTAALRIFDWLAAGCTAQAESKAAEGPDTP